MPAGDVFVGHHLRQSIDQCFRERLANGVAKLMIIDVRRDGRQVDG
jgi:hypothetical protein